MTDEERLFHKNSDRRAWCVIDGVLLWQECAFAGMNAMRWIKEQFDMDDASAEKVIRGGIYEDRIVICRGSNYAPIDMSEMPERVLKSIVDWHCKEYSTFVVNVVNGVHVGEPGTKWEAYEDLGMFACSSVHVFN